jgi:hypothetical protein
MNGLSKTAVFCPDVGTGLDQFVHHFVTVGGGGEM